MQPSGKLELTWTNKHLRLLSDERGGSTWVEPSDYRVAEVRLLHDVEAVGETHAARERSRDNLLIRGDALNALTSLCELPPTSSRASSRAGRTTSRPTPASRGATSWPARRRSPGRR